jgi:hypothetical protein
MAIRTDSGTTPRGPAIGVRAWLLRWIRSSRARRGRLGAAGAARPGGSARPVRLGAAGAAKAAEFQPAFLVRASVWESGLPRDGFAKCDQPMTLPAVVLGPNVGRLNPDAIARLDDALRFVLGL